MILGLLDEAMVAGARQSRACEILGVDARTVQRWRDQRVGEDRRAGPRTQPKNALSAQERRTILGVVNSPEFRDQSPKQIVPTLADQGTYYGSESTIYRILRSDGHRLHC